MDVKLLKWIFTVLTVVVIIKSVFLVYYEIHTILRDEITNNFLQMRCLRLRQKYSNITSAARSDIKSFSKDLSDLMSCPHMSDITHKELNRIRLRFCCNATGVLYLTKKNTAVDQSIPYETSKHSYKMNAALHRMLPKDFPWSGHHLNRCAVVGSGGILKNSRCGREIDSADYVIRFNMAPINNSDVGIKTDLLTINPSQLSAGYKNMRDNPGPLVQRVSAYGNASLIIPAFAYSYFTQLSITTLKVLYSARSQQRVVFFSSYYLKTLGHFWKKHGLKEIRLSTGFMLINVALEVCDHVHIYGFWPFDVNLEQKPVLHHYYDNKGPKRGVHSMPEEFLRLLQLHSQGALTLHLLPCT